MPYLVTFALMPEGQHPSLPLPRFLLGRYGHDAACCRPPDLHKRTPLEMLALSYGDSIAYNKSKESTDKLVLS